ncbi:MAG: hypothetical protein PHZ03_08460 [Syntrophomonas sp.]|nr:hypothetical protein [Syntrophomonas sp.]
MRKTIALTLLSSLILCFALCSVSFACDTVNNYLSAEKYEYPGDGDDAYAKTNGTVCQQASWSNTLTVSLRIKYEDDAGNVYWTSPVSSTKSNKSVASVSDTVTSNKGIMANSYHTNYCKRCSQYLCNSLGKTDYF